MANENEKIEICRLCGTQSRNCFPIFEDKNIMEQINTCLPIDISSEDNLPSNICRCCSYRLSISYKLRSTAIEVDKGLRMQLHQRQSDDACTNENTKNFSENVLNIKQKITDEENVRNVAEHIQEIHDLQSPNKLSTKEKYVCKFCSKKFKSCRLWTEHKRNHNLEMLSSKSFRSDGSKSHHVREHKKSQREQKKSQHKHKKSQSEHKKSQREHKKNDQYYECNQCGKRFSRKPNLYTHISTHLPVEARKHQCNICMKRFTRHYDLTVHKRIHSGVRPHTCDVCSSSFTQLSGMKQHRRRHFIKKDMQVIYYPKIILKKILN